LLGRELLRKVLKKIARTQSLICCEEEKWFKKRNEAETGSEGTMWKHKKLLYSIANKGQKNSLRLKCQVCQEIEWGNLEGNQQTSQSPR